MGNRKRGNTINGLVGCIASFALAFSLFAMPAMAAASPNNDAEQATSTQNETSVEPSDGNIDASSESTSNRNDQGGQLAEDVVLDIGSTEGDQDSDQNSEEGSKDEEQPSFFDSIIQFFADISPFSVTQETLQDASIQVTLRTLVPRAIQASGAQLTLTLEGITGGGTHEAAFQPKNQAYANFITDAHSGAGDAQVYATAPSVYTAEITAVPAGTYKVKVTGKNYGEYNHGATVTLQNGDRAEFSLVDSLYDNPILENDTKTGLVPYGDFNGDRKLDDADSAAIAQAVHEGSTDAIFDLTGDGNVDLADVQHFANTVKKTHAATEVTITKDVSQMDSSFNGGTEGSLKQGDTGNIVEDPAQAADSLFYDDGNTIVLRHETGADISEAAKVGFTADTKGVGLGAFVVQFPLDENNHPYNMGDGGTVTLKLDDPYAGDSEADKTYNLTANIVEATDNIKDPVYIPPDPDKGEHEYDFMMQKLKAYLYKETGQLVVKFPDSVTPVNLRSVEVEFTSTTDSTKKTIEISHMGFVDSVSELNLPTFPATPEVTGVETGDEQIQLAWEPQDDAIAYNVEVGIENQTDVYTTSVPRMSVCSHTSTGNLQNESTYNLRVRAVGQSGNSLWSAPVTATPVDRSAPEVLAAPALAAGYSQITASWDPVDNAKSYILYFKKAGDESFSSAELEATSYTVKNLESYTEYEFCLAAENDYGISETSEIVRASTTSAGGKIPWFNLINRASQNADLYPAANSFASVEVDGMDAQTAKAAVDGDFDTYIELGCGGQEAGGTNSTIALTLHEPADVRNLAFTTYMGEGYADGIENVYVRAFGRTSDGQPTQSELLTLDNGLVIRSVPVEGGSDSAAVNTVYVELPYTLIGTETLRFSFTRAGGEAATVSELALYSPSGLEDDMAAIWADDTHISLSEQMDEAAFDSLEKRIQATDGNSGELGHAAETHPLSGEYAIELANARQMLGMDDPLTFAVDTSITTANANIGGLNAWQPLGISAKAGDKLKVYVSTPSEKTGEATKLRLIASQYMGGADSQFTPVGYLLSGMNEITIPEIGQLPEGVNVERGGSLYLEYTGDPSDDAYNVSIVGATRIPVLDVSGLRGQDAQQIRSERIAAYAAELQEHVNSLSTMHSNAGHVGTGFFGMFVADDCSANLTEIVTDHAVITLPATEMILDLGSTDMADVADRIDSMTRAVDEVIDVAYQHKGLFSIAENPRLTSVYGANNDLPSARHNIRCMSIESEESICTTNNYIGIDRSGVADLLKATPVSTAKDGIYDSGDHPGVGIIHALGHQIADSAIADPEVAADYLTQLLTSHDTNESIVFDWDDVYARVTSDSRGALDAKLGAAMLWQLHLAYDEGFSHAYYDDPDDEMANLVFARMSAYARNSAKAPYRLSLDGADAENTLMRLAMAACERNLIVFFTAWGLDPDEGTQLYASNYAQETRAIQYLNDDVNAQAHAGVGVGCDDVSVSADIRFDQQAQTVTIDNVKASGAQARNVRAFEVLREGDAGYIPVGLIGIGETFTEPVIGLPESDVSYRIRALDNASNTSPATDSMKVRVEHAAAEGGIANFTMPTDKSRWTITTNMVSVDGTAAANDEDDIFAKMGCADAAGADASAAIDGDASTVFTGKPAEQGIGQQITVAFNSTMDVSGIRYYPSAKEKSFKGVDIEVSENGKDWTLVNTSMLYFPASDNYKGYDAFGRSDNAVIYFSEADVSGDEADRGKLATYRASYLRLTEWAENAGEVSIAELDVISAPIYRVSLLGEDAHFGMGKLTHDVTIESSGSADDAAVGAAGDSDSQDGCQSIFIPKGSFIIMGDYTGNPIYNTVVIKDEAGNIVADPSRQIIITDKVGENDAAIVDVKAMVYGGTWLYYFEPGTYEDAIEDWGSVHPELYRVDSADKLSDAKPVSVGMSAAIQRQGINDEIYVDLYGITLNLGAYDVYR